MKLRQLTSDEIRRLEANGCRSSDWSQLSVWSNFNPDHYENVRFTGKVKLPAYNDEIDVPPPYICNTHLVNCQLGTNIVIQDTRRVENYQLWGDIKIIGCGSITAPPANHEAHPVKINVLDETGSKQIKAYPHLSSNLAAMACADDDIRHAVNRLPNHCIAPPSYLTSIATSTIIEGAFSIKNVHIENSVYIGPGVIAEECIISANAIVTNSTHISHCFVGEWVTLSNFTAQHSMFFANSHLCNGEAASVLAGPFTVSEHKSTLLIGAQLMMFNAGSGTNQSNHLYKLGPVHHGSMGRGCKCASDSYIMWPAKIGDFTMVSGRHYSHPDTRLFPFSYLISGKDGSSILLPGENLSKCGTARDIAKWPARDKRPCYPPDDDWYSNTDHIDFEALNPATISNIIAALPLLRLYVTNSSDIHHGNVTIPVKAAKKGIQLYLNALHRYFGEKAAQFAKNGTEYGYEDILDIKWEDMGGAIIPTTFIAQTKSDLMRGKYFQSDNLSTITDQIRRQVQQTKDQWAYQAMRRYARDIYGTDFNLATVLTAWQQAEEEHLTLVLADAAKEAKMAGRPALATDDPTLNALRERLIEVRRRVAELL